MNVYRSSQLLPRGHVTIDSSSTNSGLRRGRWPRSDSPVSEARWCLESGTGNNVLLVKIEGPAWYTIYHHLPAIEGAKQTPLFINHWEKDIYGHRMVVLTPPIGSTLIRETCWGHWCPGKKKKHTASWPNKGVKRHRWQCFQNGQLTQKCIPSQNSPS